MDGGEDHGRQLDGGRGVGGAPTRVAKKKWGKGMPRMGLAMLMNQLGRKGVMRRKRR